ncbi:cancer/testis antigen 55-like [Ictidomys tridecemlineatus]|nr:cancer/testis antigen 55-like [Ictidomys tridecemlineatus]
MHRLISQALAFFRRKADSEVERTQHQRLLEDDTRHKTVQGVVTKFCSDYGWIDESIYYFNTDVTENIFPVKAGQKVTAVVEEDKTSHGLKAIKVLDFEPYKGDRVEVEFAIHPDTKSRKALSVKPLRHKHVNKVCISSVHGRHGVVADTIFFTLDSLKLPAGYVPQPNDIVDVVIVESVQSCYIWRAVSMTPVHIL